MITLLDCVIARASRKLRYRVPSFAFLPAPGFPVRTSHRLHGPIPSQPNCLYGCGSCLVEDLFRGLPEDEFAHVESVRMELGQVLLASFLGG